MKVRHSVVLLYSECEGCGWWCLNRGMYLCKYKSGFEFLACISCYDTLYEMIWRDDDYIGCKVGHGWWEEYEKEA